MAKAPKKRTKKHNPNRRAQSFFHRTRTWWWESSAQQTGTGALSSAEVWQGGRYIPLPADIQLSIAKRQRMNWIIGVRALCMSEGQQWIESITYSVSNVRLDDFADSYWKIRDLVLEGVKREHVVDVGWIAHTFVKNDWDRAGDDNAFWKLISHDLGTINLMRANAWHTLDREIQEDFQAAEAEGVNVTEFKQTGRKAA